MQDLLNAVCSRQRAYPLVNHQRAAQEIGGLRGMAVLEMTTADAFERTGFLGLDGDGGRDGQGFLEMIASIVGFS